VVVVLVLLACSLLIIFWFRKKAQAKARQTKKLEGKELDDFNEEAEGPEGISIDRLGTDKPTKNTPDTSDEEDETDGPRSKDRFAAVKKPATDHSVSSDESEDEDEDETTGPS